MVTTGRQDEATGRQDETTGRQAGDDDRQAGRQVATGRQVVTTGRQAGRPRRQAGRQAGRDRRRQAGRQDEATGRQDETTGRQAGRGDRQAGRRRLTRPLTRQLMRPAGRCQLTRHPNDCHSSEQRVVVLLLVVEAGSSIYGEHAEAAETQQSLALSSAQLPPCAPLSSDSASSPARQHPHHQPPAAHRPTPAAQQRLL